MAARVVCLALTVAVAGGCDIYDDMTDVPEGGADGESFAYVDARDYTKWLYFDLSVPSYVTLDYQDTLGIPPSWTFALHRYDCKTNKGAAMETPFSSIDDLSSALDAGTWEPREEDFEEDVEGEIIIDVAHMVEGYLTYAPSTVNEVITRWLDVDISDMPPIYTQSGRVYLLREENGTLAALRFTGFTNPYYYDAKGYISFSYRYPLRLPEK